MLVQLSVDKGNGTEVDLFVAQMVLQQLYLNEKATAVKTFATFAKFHPIIARTEPPFALPLLNFLFFLLKCCDTGKLPMFRALCDVYKTALARDPSFDKYLQKIGVVHFGAQPVAERGAGGGIFGDLIGQLFAGLDDDEGDGDGGSAGEIAAVLRSATASASQALELD